MEVFEIVVAMLLGGAALAALARRYGAPYPALVALRDDGTIGDAAFQRVEEELDWVELGWAQLDRAGQRAGRRKFTDANGICGHRWS